MASFKFNWKRDIDYVEYARTAYANGELDPPDYLDPNDNDGFELWIHDMAGDEEIDEHIKEFIGLKVQSRRQDTVLGRSI